MVLGYEVGDGAHALDVEQLIKHLQGTQVINPGGGSNEVDDNNTSDLTIRAKSGDLLVNGSVVSAAEETADLSGLVDADNPRKVLVYRDSAGNLQTNAGSAESAQPSGAARRDAYRPAPPTENATTIVVLATVWLPAGASSIANADIRDRRLASLFEIDTLDAQTVQTVSINNNGSSITVSDDLALNRGQAVTGPVDDSYLLINEKDLSDGVREAISSRSGRFGGLLFLHDDTNNNSSLFIMSVLKVNIISDPDGAFSTTKGNQGTTNVYHDNNDNTIYIENETGGPANYEFVILAGGD
jgi:hypothetical protein